MRRAQRGTVTAVAVLTAVAASMSYASAGSNPVQQVSLTNPVAGCTASGDSQVAVSSAEVETWASVDPNNSQHAIVSWQQDRFFDGGSHSGVVAFTHDGNHYSDSALPFSVCAGAPAQYPRASDLWVSWGPDGIAYANGLSFDPAAGGPTAGPSAVSVATSSDGGATWQNAQQVIADDSPGVLNDKNSVTADQRHPGVAYQVWDRLAPTPGPFGSGPALFSKTTDHGKTWSAPKIIVDTTTVPIFEQTIGNQIVEAPNGTLYDFFDLIDFTSLTSATVTESFITSTDQGDTWSQPKSIVPDTSIFDVDPNDPSKVLRAGSGLPVPAIDPATGKLWLALNASDFSGGAFDQIELTGSSDGGATWSTPVLVSPPGVPAYTPTLSVDHQSTINVSWNDLRTLQPGNTTTLPTAQFLKTFRNGDLTQGTEQQISPIFDWLKAPLTSQGYMLGDYQGQAVAGTFGAQPTFVTTQNAPGDPTDVFTGVFHGPFGQGSSGGTFKAGSGQHTVHGPRTAH